MARQDKYNRRTSYLQWAVVAQRVADEVRNSGRYTTDPGKQPLNRDFVEYFLTESNAGYCVHFASATVAMLRALDIPARYVEGYVVRKSAFGKDGWADVPSRNAHAWAEIWIPNVGWVPVESTPGGASVVMPSNSPTMTPTPSQSGNAKATPTASQTPASTADNGALNRDEKTKSSDEESSSALDIVIYIWSFIAATTLVLLLIHIAVRRRRVRAFASKDINSAALQIFAYLEQLSGFGANISEQARVIAQKARFSRHELTSAEKSSLMKEAETEKKKLMRRLKGLKKLEFWYAFY